jgi:hypothetical protein
LQAGILLAAPPGVGERRIFFFRTWAGRRSDAGFAAIDGGIEQFRQCRSDRLHIGAMRLRFRSFRRLIGIVWFLRHRIRNMGRVRDREKGKSPRGTAAIPFSLSAGVSTCVRSPPHITRSRSPDAAQRAILSARCAADPGSISCFGVPALRRSAYRRCTASGTRAGPRNCLRRGETNPVTTVSGVAVC